MFSRFILMSALVALSAVVLSKAKADPAGRRGDLLGETRWENRLLLICGEKDAALGSTLQQAQFEGLDWAGFEERKLTIIGVSPDMSMVFDTASFVDISREPSTQTLRDADVDLVQIAKCEHGAPSLTLIGLDGGVKQRWESPVSNADLFALIDAMPMRASEIRAGKR
ncbi:MAG: DUF4174 domain-containing protein [Pseudomonadota bacterium]